MLQQYSGGHEVSLRMQPVDQSIVQYFHQASHQNGPGQQPNGQLQPQIPHMQFPPQAPQHNVHHVQMQNVPGNVPVTMQSQGTHPQGYLRAAPPHVHMPLNVQMGPTRPLGNSVAAPPHQPLAYNNG